MKSDVGLSLPPAVNAFFTRVATLLLDPDTEWRRIAPERPSLRDLFVRHVGPLAGVFALGPAIGFMLFPDFIDGVRATPGPLQLIVDAVLLFVLVCAGLYGMARLVDWIAPRFGGKRDLDAALKLSAYSSTAMLASGLFGLVPALGLLMVAGLWSVFTFYKGVSPLMQSDPDKAVPFTAAVVGAMLVASLAIGAISMGARQAASIQAAPPASPSTAASPAPADGPVRIQRQTLRRMLPEALIGGWLREGFTEGDGGVMGFVGPTAEGVFVRGDQRMTLRIVDLGPTPRTEDLLAMLKQSATGDSANGYDRVVEAPGRFVKEKLDRQARRVERLILIQGRVVLQGEGVNVSEAELDAGLAAIGENRLDVLARQGG
jgi:hypothetical protein